MFKKLILAVVLAVPLASLADNVIISGNVTSKCTIHTDTPGVYGNPSMSTLSTAAASGGVQPVIRYDVVNGGFYKAVITTPTSFSSSPTLSDVVTWTGSTVVSSVSDAAMSIYTTNKRIVGNTTEFDLTLPGTVWFKSASQASYGYNRALPSGEYRAVIVAECIAL